MKAVLIAQDDLTGTDVEIREKAKKYCNGEYCTIICKTCGGYFHTIEGCTETAEIVEVCKLCFKAKS